VLYEYGEYNEYNTRYVYVWLEGGGAGVAPEHPDQQPDPVPAPGEGGRVRQDVCHRAAGKHREGRETFAIFYIVTVFPLLLCDEKH